MRRYGGDYSRGSVDLSFLHILMGVVAGISIDAALTHGLVGLSRRPRDGTRLSFAVAALAVAVGALSVVAMYSADSAQEHVAIMKWLLYPSSAVWTASLVWLVAFYTGVRPTRWLLALTAGFCVAIVLNLSMPLGLLHHEVGELREVHMMGSHAVGIAGTSPHPLNLLTDVLVVASLVFMAYALRVVDRRGERGKAAYIGVAVAAFAFTMLVDTLTDYGVVSSFYLTELCFAVVVLAVSGGLRRESLRQEAELRLYRTELESLVEARVAELDRANERLADEVRVRLAAEEALRRRVAELDSLQHLSQTLAGRTDLPSALDEATEEITELCRARFTTIHLALDAEGEPPGPLGDVMSSTALAGTASLRDFPPFKEAIDRREAIVVADPAHAELPPDLVERAAAERVRDLLVVPMVARAEVVGVLGIARRHDAPAFSESETKVAQTAAEALAAVVESERLHRRETRQAAADERQRLARELHDAVTQSIYSATLIAEALPEVWEREPSAGLRNLETLRRLVHGALAEMRTLLFELRPEALRAAPLDGLLERLGVALSGQAQISVEVRVEEDVELPIDVKIAMYRVTQEALSNIAKHARAQQVTVSLRADAAGATLRVQDDGRGFDPSAVAPDGMGLRIMRERLDQIGATIDIDSAPGRGSTLFVTWPRPAGDGRLDGREVEGELTETHSRDDRG